MPYATQNISEYRHMFMRFQNSANISTIKPHIRRFRWKLFTLKIGHFAQIERSPSIAAFCTHFKNRPKTLNTAIWQGAILAQIRSKSPWIQTLITAIFAHKKTRMKTIRIQSNSTYSKDHISSIFGDRSGIAWIRCVTWNTDWKHAWKHGRDFAGSVRRSSTIWTI